MVDKRIAKLKNLTISKKELEGLLKNFGFRLTGGRGSHTKWFLENCGIIVISSHDKSVPKYQMEQSLAVLTKSGLIKGDENEKK